MAKQLQNDVWTITNYEHKTIAIQIFYTEKQQPKFEMQMHQPKNLSKSQKIKD